MRYRWFADEAKETDEFGVPVSRAAHDEALQPQKIGYHRGEVLAIIIVMAILLYEWFHDDSQLIYVCVAFLVFELRPIALLFFFCFWQEFWFFFVCFWNVLGFVLFVFA